MSARLLRAAEAGGGQLVDVRAGEGEDRARVIALQSRPRSHGRETLAVVGRRRELGMREMAKDFGGGRTRLSEFAPKGRQ